MKLYKGKIHAIPPGANSIRLCHILDIIENQVVYRWYSKVGKRWVYGIESNKSFAFLVRIAVEEKEYLKRKSNNSQL